MTRELSLFGTAGVSLLSRNEKTLVLGKGHPDKLSSMNNLALALESQGKCAEDEAMHKRDL